jgi:hypothetical protein
LLLRLPARLLLQLLLLRKLLEEHHCWLDGRALGLLSWP